MVIRLRTWHGGFQQVPAGDFLRLPPKLVVYSQRYSLTLTWCRIEPDHEGGQLCRKMTRRTSQRALQKT